MGEVIGAWVLGLGEMCLVGILGSFDLLAILWLTWNNSGFVLTLYNIDMGYYQTDSVIATHAS